MKKDRLICFRTGEDFYESLSRVAKKERRSLSSTIETMLTNYLKNKKASESVEKEKRQYPRQGFWAAVLIKHCDSGTTKIDAGLITDISLGGVCIAIPRDANCIISHDAYSRTFDIIFTLPNQNKLIYLTCEPCRVFQDEDGIHVGAFFVDADFKHYKALQTYLI